MTSVRTHAKEISIGTASRRRNILRKIVSWLCVWELYPILGIAAFLRFYQINTTEFDEDQAMVFRMAHDAIIHGLIPATSNIASIQIVNPPAVTYLLMIPAAFSANPLWGAVFVGFLNVLAVLFTYIFVRRYFGRIAAIAASLLYATAAKPLHFSRFIWQQNTIAPFVVLFIFALFWGVVDRRKGWLFPALLLLGILVQLHETTIILSLLVFVAIVLAPGTVRMRDIASGLAALLLLFSTYLLWEFSAKFADLSTILHISKIPAHFDTNALNFYSLYLYPYDQTPTTIHTLEYRLLLLLEWLQPVMIILISCGFITTILGVIFPSIARSNGKDVNDKDAYSDSPFWRAFQKLKTVWMKFLATPERGGYLLLLIWQIVPILILSHHAVPVYAYYLLMVLPGPFIMIGIFLSSFLQWLKQRGQWWNIPRYCVYVFISLVIVAQLVGSSATLVDEANNNNLHGYSYSTLNSLQDALTASDQLALQHKLNHIYIATDQYTQIPLRYLAEQMRTPTTLFDASRCLVLPDPAAGPAVLLVGPYDKTTGILLSHFAIATLVSHPERLGGSPFQLYIVQPRANAQMTSTDEAFAHHLRLLDKQVQKFRVNNSILFATQWSYLSSAMPEYRTTYTYSMKALFQGHASITSQCVSTNIRAGDQLIVAFPLLRSIDVPSSMTITAMTFITKPLNVSYGPFHLETIMNHLSKPLPLLTTQGISGISLVTS